MSRTSRGALAPASAGARASAIQRYRFVRRLAVGGMAEVYAARALGVAGVERLVALKRILPTHAHDQAFVSMFLNEARIAATLQHPHIVQTYDVIDDGGALYIAMELLEGLTLLELRQGLQRREIGLSPGCALHIVDRVLAGLHYAHERRDANDAPLGLVHRDVSPQNVFLTREGNVKLLDFGVAKAEALTGREVTDSGVVKGKVLYMSPEQCQGLEVDRTTDLHAVGTLMYILLTGQHPFRGANPYDTMRSIIHTRPPPPSSAVPALGTRIDEIVARAMDKSPERRFRTARDMQRAIGAVVRERGWYCTDIDLGALVEAVSDPPGHPDTRNLPDDLWIGDADAAGPDPAPPPETETERPPPPVAETEHALIERVRGLTVLTLRGAIDERFDGTIGRHLRGVVLIDTADVVRITSYGLRTLIEVMEGASGQVDAMYHARCSPAFVQQVGMIRRLLAGGRIVSFALPYADPVTGLPFVRWTAGAEALGILRSRVPPSVDCPGYPGRPAEFDEDPEGYFGFVDDFCSDPPSHVAQVLDALVVKEKRRQVEKEITPDGAVVYIRRPIDVGFRWSTLLAGAEGRLRIDLDATPTWTGEGLRRLVAAVAAESAGLRALELTHMPPALYEYLRADPRLGPLLAGGTVRIHTLCARCDAPRRVAVDIRGVSGKETERYLPACPVCGDTLVVLDAVPDRGRPAAPAPAERSQPVETADTLLSPATVAWIVALAALLVLLSAVLGSALVALGLGR